MTPFDAVRKMWDSTTEGVLFDIRFTHLSRQRNSGGELGEERNLIIIRTPPKRGHKLLATFQRPDGSTFNVYQLCLLGFRVGGKGRFHKLKFDE